jgi:hypothetical protein
MAVIAGCYGVHQVTAAPDLGLFIRRQASYGSIDWVTKVWASGPEEKLWYEQPR